MSTVKGPLIRLVLTVAQVGFMWLYVSPGVNLHSQFIPVLGESGRLSR